MDMKSEKQRIFPAMGLAACLVAALCALALASACSPAQGGYAQSDASTEAAGPATPSAAGGSDVQVAPVQEQSARDASPSSGNGASESVALVAPDELNAEAIVSDSQIERFGIDAFFTVEEISDDVFAQMEGITFSADCPVARADLRYIRVLHVDAEGNRKVGEMVANAQIADELCSLFRDLYDAGYPIERMRLADHYSGDDEASMRANNTSCFNYRVVEGSGELDKGHRSRRRL